MSIQKKLISLTVEWPAIRQAATAAHGTKLNMQALEQKHGFNAADAEQACKDDTVYEEWLMWRDKAEIENLRLAHHMISADQDGLLALISQILANTNVADLT